MTRGRAGIHRRLPPAVLVLTLCVLPGAGGAESPLPLDLEEVVSGRPAKLAPGADALHLFFFAPWCPPCVEELKQLSSMEERWAERGYRLVLIAVRQRTTRERLLIFSDQYRPPGRIYLDTSGEAQRAFAVDQLPAHFLLDASGHEVGRWAGLGDGMEDVVRKLLLSASGDS